MNILSFSHFEAVLLLVVVAWIVVAENRALLPLDNNTSALCCRFHRCRRDISSSSSSHFVPMLCAIFIIYLCEQASCLITEMRFSSFPFPFAETQSSHIAYDFIFIFIFFEIRKKTPK